MSQYTPNYGLYLEDDSSTLFRNWREQINIANNSNMTKIDTVLDEKADNSIEISGMLLAASWAGNAAPWEQTVLIDGLEADQNGTIGLSKDATSEQREAAKIAGITVRSQAQNALTVIADGEKPTVDILFTLILLG